MSRKAKNTIRVLDGGIYEEGVEYGIAYECEDVTLDLKADRVTAHLKNVTSITPRDEVSGWHTKVLNGPDLSIHLTGGNRIIIDY